MLFGLSAHAASAVIVVQAVFLVGLVVLWRADHKMLKTEILALLHDALQREREFRGRDVLRGDPAPGRF